MINRIWQLIERGWLMINRIWAAVKKGWQEKSILAGWHHFLAINISAGLTKAYENSQSTKQLDPIERDRDPNKFIIFSDQHRGARNGADDFQRSERAYNAALAYYFELGFTLIALGDVEELWEERPGKVLKNYTHSLELEAKFNEDGRYLRVFGNHDDIWKHQRKVETYLRPKFNNQQVAVHESIKIPIHHQGKPVGEFFLVHGHQGSIESDYLTRLSRLFVRYFWRYFQGITRKRLTTPATDWKLRKLTNRAMYDWAIERDGVVLITGHTHYPVFASKTHEAQLEEALENVSKANLVMRAELAAELEWVRTQGGEPEADVDENGRSKEKVEPCYFNSGCCSYSDGDITGLEIAHGRIRLVRWPADDGSPMVKELSTAPLDSIFRTEAQAATESKLPVTVHAANGHQQAILESLGD